ncbi:MAG TPA: S46 family peptidase [Bacteroidales bacterium]|nr:S46 family peptidase [Bacteroidales bacterium]
MKKLSGNIIMCMAFAMLSFSRITMAQTPECDKPVEAGLYDMGKMWTFDYPPADYFKATYNFNADQKWFEEARLSSLRFADYCSASFVSADGLVMTNHHCARESGVAAQRKGENVLENGFYAAKLGDERKVEGLFVDQLVMIEDITDKVSKAVSSAGNDMARISAIQMALASVKQEYSKKAEWAGLELETVRFYNGGKYSMYGFKRYKDVRLVFMPEEQMAYFGGDYDNFTYPRYDLDCSFFRVYDEGKPLKTEHFFKYNVNGASEGDAVFVIGNPGSTSRMSTVSDLEFYRDKQLPFTIDVLSNVSSMYKEYNKKAKSDSLENLIFSLENSLKVYRGELEGLKDPCTLARKGAFHTKFRNDVMNNPLLAKDTVIWNEIAMANAVRKNIFDEVSILNAGSSFVTGQLMQYALGVVNLAAEYPDTAGSGEIRAVLSAPSDPEELSTEPELLAMYLKEAADKLGPEHPFVAAALKGKTPENAASEIISGTRMADQKFRMSLLSMDSAAIWNVNDPLLDLARIAYTRGNQIALVYQGNEAKLSASRARLGEMLFETYGTQIPPDATFSLRINDGVVKGYEYNGTIAPVNTTFYGLYDRYYSFKKEFPYNLPSKWEKPPAQILNTPLDFISTNDIIGGNSGSPMINKNLEIVGLAFDGNIESLLGSYIFIPEENRAIGVHSAGIITALKHVYKAKRLVSELEGK